MQVTVKFRQQDLVNQVTYLVDGALSEFDSDLLRKAGIDSREVVKDALADSKFMARWAKEVTSMIQQEAVDGPLERAIFEVDNPTALQQAYNTCERFEAQARPMTRRVKDMIKALEDEGFKVTRG